MPMTLLQIVQAATNEMGLPTPSTVIGNAALDVVQLLGLLNKVGRELYTNYEWQALDTEYRFTTAFLATTGNTTANSAIITNIPSTATLSTSYMLTGSGVPQDCTVQSVDSATQVTMNQALTRAATGATLTFCKTKYTMPTNYHKPVNNTQWDKTANWMMLGPTSPQAWQQLKSGFLATGPRTRWRLLGGTFQIWPMLASNTYLGFEYASTSWVQSAAGVAQSSFALDSDTSVFQDDLLISGLKLKYFSAKGFDTTDYAMDYRSVLSTILATEKGGRLLRMAGHGVNTLIGPDNIPDQGYGT